ncbi:zinc finger protein 37 isoform X2 [Cynoglossus semilaevis]|uniref:zinc finger protein 37 isoform X2 n=1 Tax=Cynoglossus semilaevis TaxID=244447 RepID=UPI000D623186|nr:zinc finger protein 37-like isoform X2 [Cynoglossus semilaevis]
MDPGVLTSTSKADSLPLASLRLLVPPLQLVTASLWQTLRRRDVLNYVAVAEFVCLVTDTVPELLVNRHRTQLILGLRARYVVELCRRDLVEPDFICSQLDKMKVQQPDQVEAAEEEEEQEEEEEEAVLNFCDLIQTLVQDTEERREFFSEVFPVEFGPDFDRDLQTLFWELLCRLSQLLPVPDLEQTVSWLRPEASVLTDCLDPVSDSAHVRRLLQHHRDRAGLLDRHVPPCSMGDIISSSLAAVLPSRVTSTSEQQPRSPPVTRHHTPSDLGAELVTVTEFAEVELETSAETGEQRHQRAEGVTREGHFTVDGTVAAAMAVGQSEDNEDYPASSAPPASVGPHDGPDCEKTSESDPPPTAHRVTQPPQVDPTRQVDIHSDCGVNELTGFHGNDETKTDDESEPDRGLEQSAEVRGSEPVTCRSSDPVTERYIDHISAVKVRTSGRKRKPTMKVQVINLQKSMTTGRKRRAKVNSPALEPETASSADHSYGSTPVQLKTSDEGSSANLASAAVSSPQRPLSPSGGVQVQQQEHGAGLQGRFSCPSCEKSFRFQSLLRAHQRIHTGEQPFLCSQCGRRFSFKQSLERHKQTHSSGREYQCLICGEFFKSSLAQREHRSTHMENGEYVCSECGRAFAWKSALVRHLKTHGESAAGDGRSYGCPHCDLSFGCAARRQQHLQTHQEQRVHRCSCGKSFTYQAALTAHQRTHQKERPHVCTQCGKGFLYRGGLLSHMKIHSEEKPFSCSHCGKSFKRERSMKKHERCHTREKVFSCSTCDKSFVYKATLTRHELTHTGERPYLCSDCGKRFFSHAELLKHERFHKDHKPFHCPHCGKKFTQSCYLTIHLRYHTGARPYSCTECNKSFLSANRLKRHQRTHSEERPHLCVECGKGFRQAYNLRMHQQTHLTFS